jgi:hypothetical protein
MSKTMEFDPEGREKAHTRISIMTIEQAHHAYEIYENDLGQDRSVPWFTVAGWLAHKNIKIMPKEQW